MSPSSRSASDAVRLTGFSSSTADAEGALASLSVGTRGGHGAVRRRRALRREPGAGAGREAPDRRSSPMVATSRATRPSRQAVEAAQRAGVVGLRGRHRRQAVHARSAPAPRRGNRRRLLPRAARPASSGASSRRSPRSSAGRGSSSTSPPRGPGERLRLTATVAGQGRATARYRIPDEPGAPDERRRLLGRPAPGSVARSAWAPAACGAPRGPADPARGRRRDAEAGRKLGPQPCRRARWHTSAAGGAAADACRRPTEAARVALRRDRADARTQADVGADRESARAGRPSPADGRVLLPERRRRPRCPDRRGRARGPRARRPRHRRRRGVRSVPRRVPQGRKRVRAFDDQLPDVLLMLAASLRAGHSLRQGIGALVEDSTPPTSTEFRRVLAEASLGRPVESAMTDMARRLRLGGLRVRRRGHHGPAGGRRRRSQACSRWSPRPFAARQQFRRKVRALTSMGRLSAYVLIALPFAVAFMLRLVNPGYMRAADRALPPATRSSWSASS